MKDQPTLLRLPVYEPAGRDVELSERDLLQHVLIVGATGSGKTCLLHRMIEQLMRHERTGLLIYDAKVDDTVGRVKNLARKCGRGGDVVVLGPQGDHYLDLFAPLRTLKDVDQMVRRLLAGSETMGTENAFWDEFRFALLDAALTILVLGERPVQFARAIPFLHEWSFAPKNATSPRLATALDLLTRRLKDASHAEERKLQQTLETLSLWRHLDDKTRSNAQSSLLNALRPLVSMSAADCFEQRGRRVFDATEIATRGAVCVASVNATVDPGLASLFFKLIKQDFYRAVHQRATGLEPLCAIVADELPLLVTREDAEALTTVRSRRCAFIAATQGLSALDERLGVRARRALLSNFGTVIIMRSREEEVDHFAATQLGTREQVQMITRTIDEGTLLSSRNGKIRERVLVCPPGTLGRLEPHQGFVVAPGYQHEHRLVFVPWFDECRAPSAQDPFSLDHLQTLLAKSGMRIENDHLVFRAALVLCSDESHRDRVLDDTRRFFEAKCVIIPHGLDALPAAWLKGLPRILWSLRQPHWTRLPFMLSELKAHEGLLQVRFEQESMCPAEPDRFTAWDWIRVKINSSLYPSRWRPLSSKHRRHLGVHRAEPSPPGAPPMT